MERPPEDLHRMLDDIEFNIDQLQTQISEICGTNSPSHIKVIALNDDFSRHMHADLDPEVIQRVYAYFQELHDLLQAQPELQDMALKVREMFKECVES